MPWANTKSGNKKAVPMSVSHCFLRMWSLFFKVLQSRIIFTLLQRETAPYETSFSPWLPIEKHWTLILRALRGVWEETLPMRFSLVTNQFLPVEMTSHMTSQFALFYIISPFYSSLSSSYLTFNGKSFHTSPFVPSSHSLVSFLTLPSHLAVLSSLSVCVSLRLSPPLSL